MIHRTLVACALALLLAAPKAEGPAWVATVRGYVETLARPGGGYGWADQADAHLAPTFAAVGILHRIGEEVPEADAVAAFVRTHHPVLGADAETRSHPSVYRRHVYRQLQSLLWLGADVDSLREVVSGWRAHADYTNRYEAGGNPVFIQEMTVFVSRALLGLDAAAVEPAMIAHLQSRRRPDGSFNTTPAADGSPGNVLNTHWGLRALAALGRADSLRDETVAWLRAAQLPGGGFTYRPGAEVGGVDDVAYTWAAVTALAALGAAPADREACIGYLLSLWNADGGFGDRPGLPSRPMATYYALAALDALDAFDRLEAHHRAGRLRPPSPPEPLPEGLEPYTIHIQAQGNGSVREAVELARVLGIDLWGAKNPEAGWVRAAQSVADARGVPVTFFVAAEEYGDHVGLPGLGAYSHVSDPIAPASAESLLYATRATEEVTAWETFSERRVGRLQEGGGRMVWQINDNEPLTRVMLDHSLQTGRGYAAISTFHMAQNFTFSHTFLRRYRHEIPFVALHDAHGDEAWWWADDLTGYRTLFLAEAPTWEGWLEALAENRVVAVRHDAVTRYRTRMLGGAPGVQAFLRDREEAWRWWGDDPRELRRPWASLVALAPGDAFETARPEHGRVVRLRLWWTGRGTLDEPAVDLVRLTLDGERVTPVAAERRDARGRLVDAYHTVAVDAPGVHEVTATLRRRSDGRLRTQTLRFDVPE